MAYRYTTYIRVRYGETDQMGYVYYGNYALYYEESRANALRQLGFSYKDLEDMGVMMPVMSMQIDYYRPAFYDELLSVESEITELKPDSNEIIFHTTIYNESKKKINDGKVKLAFVDAATRKRLNIPPELFEVLKGYF